MNSSISIKALHRLGKRFFKQDSEIISGRACEISDHGQLQIELPTGEKIWLNSGEVSLTKWYSGLK